MADAPTSLQQRTAEVLDRAPIGIALADGRGRFVQANPAFCELLGHSEAELRALTWADVTHPDDRAVQVEARARLATGELRTHTVEKRYLRADGSVRWGRTTVSLLPGEGGAAPHFVAVVEDVSERRRTERALRESEARYAHIAANVPGMVYQYVFRPDGTRGYTVVSEGARALFGIAPDEVLRDRTALTELIPPDDRAEFDRLVLEAAERLTAFHWEGRVVLRSGEERFVQVEARDRKLDDGCVVSDGLVIDVTELRQTARRLEESEQRYRSLFDQNPDAVFSLDAEGRYLSANAACAAMTGYALEEVLGRSFEPFIEPDQLDAARGLFRAAIAGTAATCELAIRHRAGHRVEMGVTALPTIVGGRIVGVFGIAKDLTAQRALEHQLRQAQKMEAVGRLAGGVAHDFNNLLLVIQSCCSLASSELAPHAPAQADLAQIQTAANRAADLTRQLLAFGRQQMLQPRRLDLNATVSGLAGMLRRLIGEDIRLDTELAPAVWPVHADPGQLEQVLMNLAVNARDAMPQGGTLRLRTAKADVDAAMASAYGGLAPGEYAALVVEDTGVGIDAAALSRIFEPFFTTKGPGKGTGLGLATVYGIVTQSGGHVYAESTPGRGSRFTVLLPRMVGGALPEEAPSPSPAPPRGAERILLVEDDPTVRAAVRRQLEQLGYAVCAAASGAEALLIARDPKARFDLLLTDVVMPDLGGDALVEQLGTSQARPPVLYMSGYADDEVLRSGPLREATSFLEKPFTLDRLAHAVRRAIEGARGAAAQPSAGVPGGTKGT